MDQAVVVLPTKTPESRSLGTEQPLALLLDASFGGVIEAVQSSLLVLPLPGACLPVLLHKCTARAEEVFPRIVEEPDSSVQALKQGGRRVSLVDTEISSTAGKTDRRLAWLLVDVETLSEFIALQEPKNVLSTWNEGCCQAVAETGRREDGRVGAWGVKAVAGLPVGDTWAAASLGS